MKNLYKIVSNFLREEEGLTIVEYAVAGALIAAGLVASFQGLRDAIMGVIDGIAGILSAPPA